MKTNNRNIFLKDILLIVYDFDGVMTNNKVIVREDGLESVIVCRSDGLAIEIIRDLGIRQLIISKETNKVVESRAKKLGIPVLHGIDNKETVLRQYCLEHSIDLLKVVYLGNDINDVEAMKLVGYPLCPQDAYPEAKAVAKVIIPVDGGNGVVRELLKYIEAVEE